MPHTKKQRNRLKVDRSRKGEKPDRTNRNIRDKRGNIIGHRDDKGRFVTEESKTQFPTMIGVELSELMKINAPDGNDRDVNSVERILKVLRMGKSQINLMRAKHSKKFKYGLRKLLVLFVI